VHVRFGDFELNLASETLWRKGARVRVQQQPLQLLVSLLERPGQLVTREELFRKLWPAASHRELGRNLNTALRKVRLVLRDSSLRPRYVETVRGHGYRFLLPVERVEPSPLAPMESPGPATRRGERLWAATVFFAVLVAIVAALAAGLCRDARAGSSSIAPRAAATSSGVAVSCCTRHGASRDVASRRGTGGRDSALSRTESQIGPAGRCLFRREGVSLRCNFSGSGCNNAS
jgi:DNA-binding winged helix-turn-helix (wHTH) protein